MFVGITAEAFDHPEFKEDAVRELIIAPIIARLGYYPVGETRVVRSKTLTNQFIRTGTRNHPVTTIPDYTFFVDAQPRLVLDAKGPTEEVLAPEHVQQAYSYAVHPEIRCDHFALCNGRELAVFDLISATPLLHLRFEEYEEKWEEIEKFLSVKYLREPRLRTFSPDLGTAIKAMGFGEGNEMTFLGTRLNLFCKLDDATYSASSHCDMGFGFHLATFDFHSELLNSILSGLPPELKDAFVDALSKAPFTASAGLHIEVDIKVRLGESKDGQSETFIPLIIQEVMGSRFNALDVPPPETDDTPPHIFKLRDAFRVKVIP